MRLAWFAELARRTLAAEHWVTRLPLAYREGPQTLAWEIFQGHLVPTRHQRTLWTASVFTGEQELFSLQLDEESATVHVTRCVESYRHEPIDTPEGLTTRETRAWVRELLVSLPLHQPHLEQELRLALQRAVWGTRLPLTAAESPHPLFSCGQLAYGLREAPLSRQLEARFRLLDSSAAQEYQAWQEQGHDPTALPGVIWAIFEDLSLTPWSDLPWRLLDLLALAVPPEQVSDWYARLLLLLTRHLTAYDLHVFHQGGLNYPDALLIEELLKRLVRLQGWQTPLQRRALRQGWLVGQEYMLHLVPDVPTAPGERNRVYAGQRPSVQRVRVLFPEPLPVPQHVLQQSLRENLEELGTALYLDRPLGVGKRGIEPDATPLVASRLYSASLARERWLRITSQTAPDLSLPGIAVQQLAPPTRAACLSLSDALRLRDDWVIRRTLPGSLRRLGLRCPGTSGHVFARTPAGWTLWDESYHLLHTWPVPEPCEYVWREGVEWPVGWLDGALHCRS